MGREFIPQSALNVAAVPLTALPLTIAAWMKPDSVTSAKTVGGIGSNSPKSEFSLMNFNTAFWAVSKASATTTAYAISTATLAIGNWYHCCGVFAADNDRRAFINGGNKGTSATNIVVPTPIYSTVGQRPNQLDAQGFDGPIAEFSIWDVALTDEEVAILALGYSPLLVRPQSLVLYLPLIRDEDEDLIGGISFTAVSGPAIGEHPRIFYVARPVISRITAGAAYSLTAAQGSYTYTGQASGTLADRKIAGAQGSYTYTGQTANTLFGRRLTADQGVYSCTGQATLLAIDRVIGAAQGSYTLTGQAINLNKGFILAAAQGSYSLTGQATGLLLARLLTAIQGSYTLSGQTAGLTISRTIAISQGNYTLSGQAVGLLVDRTLAAAQGSYSLTGQSANLNKGFTLIAGQGSYILTGQTTGFSIGRLITADYGSYMLTGQTTGFSIGRLPGVFPDNAEFMEFRDKRTLALFRDKRTPVVFRDKRTTALVK